jgi:hypothetical protein
MCILRGVVFCASFEVPCYVHPSRCCVLCILRDALLCASFEVLCFVHPSRCLVMCILRGAVFCASFEMPYYVHPSRRRSLGFCFFGKTSPPFLTSRCPEAVYVEKRVLFCGTLIDYLLTTEVTRGNFVFLEKRLPPFLRAVVFGGFCSFCFVWIE